MQVHQWNLNLGGDINICLAESPSPLVEIGLRWVPKLGWDQPSCPQVLLKCIFVSREYIFRQFSGMPEGQKI